MDEKTLKLIDAVKYIHNYCRVHKCETCPLFYIDDDDYQDCILMVAGLPVMWSAGEIEELINRRTKGRF